MAVVGALMGCVNSRGSDRARESDIGSERGSYRGSDRGGDRGSSRRRRLLPAVLSGVVTSCYPLHAFRWLRIWIYLPTETAWMPME